MPPEVVLRLAVFGALGYFGLYTLTRPSAAIQWISGLMTRLQEFEAVLTQQPAGEPIELDEGGRSQAVVRMFGLAFVCSSLFGAATQLSGL